MQPFMTAILIMGMAGTAAPAASQAQADPPMRQCFSNRNVTNFVQEDARTVNIRVGAGDYFRLTTMSDCRDIAYANGVALQSHAQQICDGIDVTIIVPNSISPRRCEVRTVQRLTAAEVAALPRGAKP